MEQKRPILHYLSNARSDYYKPLDIFWLSLIAIKYEPQADEKLHAIVDEIFENRMMGLISIDSMHSQLIDVYANHFHGLRVD